MDSRLDVPEHAAKVILPAAVKNVEILDFKKTEEVALVRMKNEKVHMYVGTAANILRLKVSFFHFGTGSDLVCTFFPGVKWSYHFRPMQIISSKFASSILVSSISKVRRLGPAGRSTRAYPL